MSWKKVLIIILFISGFINTSFQKVDFNNSFGFRMKGTGKNTVSQKDLSENPSLASEKNSLKSKKRIFDMILFLRTSTSGFFLKNLVGLHSEGHRCW